MSARTSARRAPAPRSVELLLADATAGVPDGAHTLALARRAFIDAVKRATTQTERTPMLDVLDAFIRWSLERPTRLRFRADDARRDVVSFTRTGSGVLFWSARPGREELPRIELLPTARRLLPAEELDAALATLNAHSRQPVAPGQALRIGFGALKNAAARAAVLARMDQLLVVT